MNRHSNELILCRHGEHEEISGLSSWQYPLTQFGIDQVNEASKKYNTVESEKNAISVTNVRSINTAEILIGRKQISNINTRPKVGESTVEGIKISDTLLYDDPYLEPVFGKALEAALDKNTIPGFMLYESDKVGYFDGTKVSTLTTMARNAFELISRESESKQDKLTFLIGREMYYFSLFARIRSFVNGPSSADDYLAEYSKISNKKLNDVINIGSVVVRKHKPLDTPSSYEFQDQYGEIIVEGNDILELKSYLSKPLTQRIGAYVLPRVMNDIGYPSYVVLDYGEGLGFIGGGLKKGETLMTALRREVKEELGANIDNDFEPYTMLARPHRFSSTRGDEELHVAVANVKPGIDLNSQLKKVKTKSMTLKELLESRGLQKDLRKYLETWLTDDL